MTVGGKIIAAAQEERFTRIKHTAVFPTQAIKYCLEEGGFEIDELDAVVFYEKPLLKFERLLQTYYAFAPAGLISFLKAMPLWLREKIFLKKIIRDGLKKVGVYNKKKLNLLFTEHHVSHAASAFFPSPFQKAAILTIDGVGEWCTASISSGENGKISPLKEMNFPHSVGLLYSAFTYYLGFTVNSGEYKLMGLAPYGNPGSEKTYEYIRIIKKNLVDIKEDGSVWLNQSYFSYATRLRMVNEKKWEQLFGFERRKPDTDPEQYHCNLALAVQLVTEEIVLKMAITAKKITGADYLCLAGGVALNCVANGKLCREKVFKDIYIPPAPGDAGGALGAALAVNYMYFGSDRLIGDQSDPMQGAFLGPAYAEKEILLMNRKVKAVYKQYHSFSELAAFTALKLNEGHVVGWFQGRMEFGPRALGNRSILGDPRNHDMQKKLNLKIKYREGFRPFAPSVLDGRVSDYFEWDMPSPYMSFVVPVKKERQKKLPDNYQELPLPDKLYVERSDIQPVTHIDFSARIHTVDEKTNPRFRELIHSFEKLTGYGLLVNTSFNVRGEPMVCTPNDAYRCFMNTGMDYLVIGDFMYEKTKQPVWANKEKWQLITKAD